MTERREVTVHITFLKVGEINTLKECYDAEVLIKARWREPACDALKGDNIDWDEFWNPKLYIDNVLGDPKIIKYVSLLRDAQGESYVEERRRIKGTFMEQMELWEFPFDVQDLALTVMSDLPSHEVKLSDYPDEIHKIYKQTFIDEQEWYLYKCIESEKQERLKDRADPRLRRSALCVRCLAARRPAYFIWNIFLVTFFLSILGLVTFAVPYNLPQNRLQLTFTLILTAVAFKFVVNQSLPRISYLTYLDRYILATMVIQVTICFWHGLQTLIPAKKYPNRDPIALAIISILYLAYNIQFILRLVFIPYKKRRLMKHKETEYVAKVKEQAQQTCSRGDQILCSVKSLG